MKVYRDPLLKIYIIILVVTVTGQGDNRKDIITFQVMHIINGTGVFVISKILPLLVAVESTLRAPGKATKTKRRMQVVTSCWLSEEMPFLSLQKLLKQTSCWKKFEHQKFWQVLKKIPALKKVVVGRRSLPFGILSIFRGEL